MLLFYTNSEKEWTWNTLYTPYDHEYIQQHYNKIEAHTGKHFKDTDLPAARPGGDTLYEWKGHKPPPGRFLAYSQANMHKFEEEGRLYYTSKGFPRLKQYLDEMPGLPLQDVWDDIPPINSQAIERLGYPTQKPEALLERIIRSSSNANDIVLDPFCGCGTAISVAQRLKRPWMGIDITHIAIGLIKSRLRDSYGDQIKETYKVIGEPTVLSEVEALAQDDPYQFQWLALGIVGARHIGQKKGADKGIDGRLFFHDRKGRKTHQIILSVKSGHLKPDDVRGLLGVVHREQAAIGVLITLHPPTRPMKADAASAGFYEAPEWNRQRFARIQILTIADLLAGKEIQYPKGLNVTYRVAPKGRYIEPENQQLAL